MAVKLALLHGHQTLAQQLHLPSVHVDMPAQAALKAAVEGMELCGEGEAEPPEGSMRVRLMRHQRLALHWMLAREAATANPRGGILADDQVSGPAWAPRLFDGAAVKLHPGCIVAPTCTLHVCCK